MLEYVDFNITVAEEDKTHGPQMLEMRRRVILHI